MKESSLKKNIASLIRKRGGWARSIPQGIHSAGMSDIVFVYRGYGGGLEVKLPGKEHTLTKLQATTLGEIRKAGGIGKMVTSVAQVGALLDALDRKKDRKLHAKS